MTAEPAIGVLLLEVTRYLAAGPATVVMLALVPVLAAPSVAVTVWIVPAVVSVVKLTVAMPLALVVLVAVAKLPPTPVLDQVTTMPEVDRVVVGVGQLSADRDGRAGDRRVVARGDEVLGGRAWRP